MDASIFRKYADAIGQRYFVDPLTERFSATYKDRQGSPVRGKDHAVDHWRILMGLFAYASRGNLELLGSPGFGKTTYANAISAVMSGLPFDLHSSLQLQGHQDQTKDTMLARADLGRLAEEGVVWQPGIFLPALTIDEFTRLSPGKQAVLLEYIRTSVVEHLGKVYANGKQTVFATFNPEGTNPLSAAMDDRFDLSLEFGYLGAGAQDPIEAADARIREELYDPKSAQEAREFLLNKGKKEAEKHAYLDELGNRIGAKRAVKPIPRSQLDAVYKSAMKLPLAPQAHLLLDSLMEEANTTRLYGLKREHDPIDAGTHNQSSPTQPAAASPIVVPGSSQPAPPAPPNTVEPPSLPLANACIQNPLSPRFLTTVRTYSRLLAASLGDPVVSPGHILAVAPYAMAHRLRFTDDYRAAYEAHPRLRGESQSQDLSRRLLGHVKDRLDAVENDLRIADHAQDPALRRQLSPANAQRLAHLQATRDLVDHPLLRRMLADLDAAGAPGR